MQCWADANYNSNTYDCIVLNSSIKAKAAITASHLIVGDSSGFFHLGASPTFDVNKPILYCGTSLAASSSGTNNYLAYLHGGPSFAISSISWGSNVSKTFTGTFPFLPGYYAVNGSDYLFPVRACKLRLRIVTNATFANGSNCIECIP